MMSWVFKRIFTMIFLMLSFICFSSAADICEVVPLSDKLIGSRGSQIHFPDGRHFSVIGHMHGSRWVQNDVLSILNSDTLSVFNLPALQNILSEYSRSLIHFKGDLAYLEKVSSSVEQDLIVWVEASASVLQSYTERLRIVKVKLDSFLPKLSLGNRQIILDAFLFAASSPVIHFALDHSNLSSPLSKYITIQPLEDLNQEIVSRWNLRDALKKGSLSFSELQIRSDSLRPAIQPLIDQLDELVRDADLAALIKIDLAAIDSYVDQLGFTDEIDRSLRMRLKAYLLDSQTFALRDKSNTDKMLNSNKNAILFLGEIHQEPTMIRLQKACLNLNSKDV